MCNYALVIKGNNIPVGFWSLFRYVMKTCFLFALTAQERGKQKATERCAGGREKLFMGMHTERVAYRIHVVEMLRYGWHVKECMFMSMGCVVTNKPMANVDGLFLVLYSLFSKCFGKIPRLVEK